MAPPTLTLQAMQQYWRDCQTEVPATKKDAAHISLLPCPSWQDTKAANISDEKFRVSAAEKQFLASLKLPFDLPVKGGRNEKETALRYRYLVRIGAGIVAATETATAGQFETPTSSPTVSPESAAMAECDRLHRQLHLAKIKAVATQKVPAALFELC